MKALWLAGLLSPFGACQRTLHEAAGLPVSDIPAAEVVATVDGRPISDHDIAVQASTTGTSADRALQDLIAADLLAAEAQRRQVTLDAEDGQQIDAERVRRFLELTFEHDVTPATIPQKILQRGYASNTTVFYHSEYADVWHILVAVGPKAPGAERAAAKARAEAILAQARANPHLDLTAFQALAGGLKLEHIVTARDGWTVKEFSYAAHDIKKPGDVSNVVETSYGYHVIYLVRRIPAEHVTLAEATPRLRPLIFPTWQRQRFLEWTAELTAQHHIELHPELLRPSLPAVSP